MDSYTNATQVTICWLFVPKENLNGTEAVYVYMYMQYNIFMYIVQDLRDMGGDMEDSIIENITDDNGWKHEAKELMRIRQIWWEEQREIKICFMKLVGYSEWDGLDLIILHEEI